MAAFLEASIFLSILGKYLQAFLSMAANLSEDKQGAIMKPKILVLDDDSDILQLFKGIFSGDDVELLLENDSESALRRIMTDRPNVAIIDISLPERSGLDVL